MELTHILMLALALALIVMFVKTVRRKGNGADGVKGPTSTQIWEQKEKGKKE